MRIMDIFKKRLKITKNKGKRKEGDIIFAVTLFTVKLTEGFTP